MTLTVMLSMLPMIAASSFAADVFDGHAYYVGDLHAHTGVSGDAQDATTCTACGDTLEAFNTARTNGLDFVAVTDHVNGGPSADAAVWAASFDRALDADAPDEGFVTIPAAEVFVVVGAQDLGHKTLLMFGDNDQLRGITSAEMSPSESTQEHVPSCDRLWVFAQNLANVRGPLALIPHHPTAGLPMATDWSCHSDVWQPAVEVYSKHGSGLGDGTAFDPITTNEVDEGSARFALDEGIHLAFLGGTDRHDTLPGEVCLLDDERGDQPKYGGGLTIAVLDATEVFNRAAVGRAISEGRTLATSGPSLPVSVVWNGTVGLGEEIIRAEGSPIQVDVRVPVDRAGFVVGVEVVTSDGTLVLTVVDEGGWCGEITDSNVTWAYVRVAIDGDTWWSGNCDDGGADGVEYIWSSPSYVVPGDAGAVSDVDCDAGQGEKACGCRAAATPPMLAVTALVAVLGVRRRRPHAGGRADKVARRTLKPSCALARCIGRLR